MSKTRRLKEQAKESCVLRGHQMRPFRQTMPGVFLAECRQCDKWVQVKLNPAPNSIDIGGPAVALGCFDKES